VLIERFRGSSKERECKVSASGKKRRGGVINVEINGFENEIGVIERE
jgi:hypothetical protein